MNGQQVVLHGRIQPDGTLYIDEKVDLPPGPVQVTVAVSLPSPAGEDTRSVLEQIRARRQARGAAARSKEEIDAELNAMRDEDERRMREIEAIGRPPRGSEK
jgi:hypothetical protein